MQDRCILTNDLLLLLTNAWLEEGSPLGKHLLYFDKSITFLPAVVKADGEDKARHLVG